VKRYKHLNAWVWWGTFTMYIIYINHLEPTGYIWHWGGKENEYVNCSIEEEHPKI